MLRFACGWTHCPLFPLLLSALGLMAWMLRAGVGVVQPARQEGSQSLDSLIPCGHLVSLAISQRCETLFWLFGVSEAMVENAQPLRTRRFHQMSSLQPQDGTLILAWCQALQSLGQRPTSVSPALVILGLGILAAPVMGCVL